MSQPTLSAGIKSLEDMFGVMLVQRGSRFRGFTPEGERVLEWARRIVGDTRAMRQDMDALKRGLVGHIRIAAIPTALAMTAMLTTPYRAKHPEVRFTILSRTSIQTLSLLENLEVDAGLTYLDNEPLGRVKTVLLYQEEYRLLTSAESAFGNRDRVTWAEVGKIPLCLLTPDMQNRRIIDGLLRSAGAEPSPTLESNSMIVLFAHVRTGRWASIMPAKLAETLGLTDSVRSIPIVEPAATHAVGLVVPDREPTTPLITALVAEARQLAKTLGQPSPVPGEARCRAEVSVRPEAARGPRSQKQKSPDRAIRISDRLRSVFPIAPRVCFVDSAKLCRQLLLFRHRQRWDNVPSDEPWNAERAAAIISAHCRQEGATLPILHALQEVFGHVPEAAVTMVAQALNLSRAEVHGVVTFYHDFRREPPGRHVLKLCRAEACQAAGGNALAARAQASLGVAIGETSPDRCVTLEPVYCLGLCATAPAAMLDGRVVGRLDAARLDALLAQAQR